MFSELAEKLEALRKNKKADIEKFITFDLENDEQFYSAYQECIKDSDNAELAGTLIRIFDLAGYLGIDIDNHVKWEMRYNSLRCSRQGKLHGKEF